MTIGAWVQAARLPSQSYIALPIVLGQLAFTSPDVPFDWAACCLAQLFGLFDQLYIVFANDYADRETDRKNRTSTLFSGGSRVLVEGRLAPRQLLVASLACAALALAVSAYFAIHFGRFAPLGLGALGIGLLWLYSFPPLALSYRGGGEVLQMLGVGLVLPLYGFAAQGGSIADFPWHWLAFLLPVHLAAALATTLPDEPSDRESDKRTLAVLIGGKWVGRLIVLLGLFGTFALYSREPELGRGIELGSIVPLLASFAVALLDSARPGTKAMVLRVFFAVLSTLSLVSLMIIALLRARS